ncbi:MAG: hypothetical protein J6C51_08120 [Clostridia bacterium]|nr:hypothetical protein [Clostridia bacterium]
MDKETLDQTNKAAYIVLIVLAALITAAAMVFGMLDMRLPSYTAAGCACLVTTGIVFHTIRSGKKKRR